MTKFYEWELYHAAHVLVNNVFKVRVNEIVAITADTMSDERVVEVVAGAAQHTDAKVIVVWMLASPYGVGKQTDLVIPVEALSALLSKVDVWIEFNYQWLLYSTVFENAFKENKKLRYMCLAGMGVDQFVRLIGRVNIPILQKLQDTIVEILKKTKNVRITSPAGTDVTFEMNPKHPIRNHKGDASIPGSHMVPGQISWAPIFESINGVIVFDGIINPPFTEPLKEPIKLYIEKGEIKRIEGGREARIFEDWLKKFNHSQMFKLAHVAIGINPEAKLTGNIVESERVWGATEWGIGYVGSGLTGGEPIPAPTHTDGITLNSSIWFDNTLILDKGKFIESTLIELAKQLKAQ
ncbi:MAG: aminopeptidase [Candidatus Methanomethylicia archaeon]|nr:aminopeptidase [Candidatus Methanomethylicia archaeon]